jgi:hypothetical protein
MWIDFLFSWFRFFPFLFTWIVDFTTFMQNLLNVLYYFLMISSTAQN